MRLTDEQIGAELHALRETPEETFAARLDGRASAGFPALKATRNDRELTWTRLLPAFGTLAAIAVVAVVISSNDSGRGGGQADLEATPSAPTAVAPKSAGGTSDAQPLRSIHSDAVAGPQAASAPGTRPRNGHPQVQERSASLGLSTDAGKLEDAANGAVQVTQRYDGIVDSSTVHAGGSNGHASFSLRIPTQHLNDAMTDLSDLGRITTRDTGSSNVTGAYVDAGKAYADARAKVDSLLEQLNSASPSEAPSIRIQLDVARQQLAAARAALRGLKGRVAYTPVSVEITAQGDGTWSIGDAADDAVGVLEAIGGAALITLAVLVPLGVLSALAWFGAQALQRRRRESSLDS
jgi:uncharacterized protein DUF4349